MAQEEETPPTNDIVVTGARAQTAGKSSVPLLETPQNIQVLSTTLLKDQGISLLDDALRNVSGVSPGGVARAYDFYRIRGFDASSYTYVDGLPRGLAINAELAGIEQVEVVKGPSSGMYGRGSAGGLVNLVSKKPRKDAFVTIEGSYGSFSSTNGLIDGGGTLNAAGNLYARLVVNYRDDKSFIDFNPGTERLYVAPSLTFEPSDRTKITLLASVSKDWSELIPGQPAEGLVYAGPLGYYDRHRYIGDPKNMGQIDQTVTTGGYEIAHRFSDAVSLYQRARITDLDLAWTNLQQPLVYDPATGLQTEYSQDYYEDRQIYGVDSGLEITADTGPLVHRLLLGAEYNGRRAKSESRLGFSPTVQLDLYNPDYSVFQYQARTSITHSTSRSDAFGFYAQDDIKLGRLNVRVGGRYETVDLGDDTQDAFTPNIGASFAIANGLNLYGSFARSFAPQAGLLDIDGNQIDPERGTQYEAGLKFAPGGRRLTATVAIYELTRSNVATAIPTAPGRYAVTGKQRSKGFEFDGQFEVMPGWQVIANYALTEAKVVADNTLPVGDWVLGVPRHQAGLWSRYELRDGNLRGLAFSLGGSHFSKQAGAVPNTYFLPAYTVVNGNVTYRTGPFSARLNVNNIFDKRYASSSSGTYFVVTGNPRIATLTLGVSY
ncbi:hypothetical protein TS85_04290 [Sphingomonas hengshuiensis]|uniref:TonB-dependent siderophore receptor n=1 Tax=Sphingomonas hengshuiensis TaxID=1609977 RepID=A0A7U4J6L3_9SPHN|nr:hypothetical protein TS85_04290 [Sphingomonas hengshuiensis]